jgi:hypothetical protein
MSTKIEEDQHLSFKLEQLESESANKMSKKSIMVKKILEYAHYSTC